MGLWERGFVEFLIEKVKKEGILGDGYDYQERESDVIDMILEAYEEFNGD